MKFIPLNHQNWKTSRKNKPKKKNEYKKKRNKSKTKENEIWTQQNFNQKKKEQRAKNMPVEYTPNGMKNQEILILNHYLGVVYMYIADIYTHTLNWLKRFIKWFKFNVCVSGVNETEMKTKQRIKNRAKLSFSLTFP